MLLTRPLVSRSIAYLDSYWAILGCWIITTILIYVAGNPPAGPAVFPDEVCRLGWARLLSGTGPHYEMSPGSYCQPYYPLLLAPVQLLTHDPASIQKAVFAINSAFAAACLPLAVRLGVRHFRLDAAPAWVAGFAILAYPSLTLYNQHALPETALFPVSLLAFGLWCNWIDRPDWRRFWGLLAMALVLYALHRKMLLVPMTLMAGAIAGHWFNRTPEYRMRLLLTAMFLAMAFFLDELAKSLAISGHFRTADAGAIESLSRLPSLEQLGNSAGRAAGVLVYASLVTGGCIWLILGNGLTTVQRGVRQGFASLDAFDRKSAYAFGMVALLGAVTATYFGGSLRFDVWFYGRHVDAALAMSLLPAVAMVAQRRVKSSLFWWTFPLIPITLVLLAIFIPGPPWTDFSPIHVIGAGTVMDLMFQAADRRILLAYCAAVLTLASVIYLARLPGLFRYTALVPFAILAATTHMTTRPFEGVPLQAAVPKPAADMLNETELCHLHWDAGIRGRLKQHQYFRLQYHFQHCSIEVVLINDPLPPGSLLVIPRERADCSPETECHDIHPDLVLYRIAEP